MPIPRRYGAVLAFAALMTAACTDSSVEVDDDQGAIGPDADVTDDLSAVQVQLAYPEDGLYAVGEDAPLYVGFANSGRRAYELVDVRGPDFADAEIIGDGDTGAIEVPEDSNVYVGADEAPAILLEGLTTDLRSSQSIPVTFVFEDAGEITIEAMVSSQRGEPNPPFAEDVDPE